MESPVSAHDEFHLCLKIGDPAGQTTLELLAFLVAIRLWAAMFRCKARKLLIKSDSSAALAAVGRLASGVAVLNFLAGEISMCMEENDMEGIVATHVAGKLNVIADYLSRLHAPGAKDKQPSALVGTRPQAPPERRQSYYRLPSPGAAPRLWAARAGDPCDLLASGLVP